MSFSLRFSGFLALIFTAGCGSSPPISASLSAPTTQTDQGKTIIVTAQLANDGSNRGVTRSLNGPGSLTGEAEWLASENNRRAKYYLLTSSGKAQLRAEERDWRQVVKIMTAAIESA